MKNSKLITLLATGLLNVFSCGSREDIAPAENKEIVIPKEEISYTKYTVPISGNSFVTVKPNGAKETIDNKQLREWTNPNTIISTYFRVSKSGKLNIGLKASVPDEKFSIIKVSINDSQKEIILKGSKFKEYNAGEFQISEPGYVKVDIQGVEKTGGYFADVTDITFSGEAATGENIFANKPELYSRARSGASSTVIYNLPKEEIHYFYSEIMVPEEEDRPGNVFSAGFRRGLFSMINHSGKKLEFNLDGFTTNSRISVIRKGDKVTNNSKDELRYTASLDYNWEAGKTYKFLIEEKYDGSGNTDYTGWFLAPGETSWRLIVSLKKQKYDGTNTRIFYNQLNPSYPNDGYMSRKAEYKNPWVKTKAGKWIHLAEAEFGVHEIYENKQRTDAIGKVLGDRFILKNGGFFNEIVKPGTKLSIPASTTPPNIDFAKLP